MGTTGRVALSTVIILGFAGTGAAARDGAATATADTADF
jgi:hypothetical protein